jgi:molybdenum cofactor cytidylyltransferase
MDDGTSIALLLLAAGGSKRMGTPKQLLIIDEQPLIRHAALNALEARFQPTAVVLGAYAADIRPLISDLPLLIVENPHWAQGMSGSLRVGLEAILRVAPRASGLIVMLADQPRLPASQLVTLANTHRRTGQSIVASSYSDHIAPPAYIGREHFAALRALTGDAGARHLLATEKGESVPVPPGADIDVDTIADYERLVESAPAQR